MSTDGVGEARSSVAEVVAYIFERYPHSARRAGLHEYDACLPDPGPRSQAGLERLRTTVLGSLKSLPGTADPGLRADLDAAAKFLEVEQFEAESLGWDHPAPAEQLAEVDVSVYLRGPYAPLRERVDALGRHLEAVPEFLRRAGSVLGATMPAGARLRSTEQAAHQSARFRALAGQLAAEHPGLDVDRVAGAAGPAAAACEEYTRAIAGVKPVSGVLGPELLAALLRATEGMETPVSDLLEEAWDEVTTLVAALDMLAARVGAAGRAEAYALLADQVSDRPVADAMRSAVDSAREFWEREGIVPVEVATPLEVALVPAGAGSAEIVFDVGGPLEKVPQSHLLHVPDLRGDDPGSVRRQYLNDPMLAVIAVHETFAGHYVHTEAGLARPGVMRNCVRWSAGFPEGWSHYTEELAIEYGFAEDRPLVEIAQLKSALEAAVRLLVFLSVHLGRWSFTEAVQQVTGLCQWSPDRAVREVLVTTAHISTAMYALGKLRIRAWRRSLGPGVGRDGLRTFHGRLVQGGYAPLSTVWNHYRDLTHAEREAN
jgi:hypothetical protein